MARKVREVKYVDLYST